jgi:hypothetical protein
MAEESKDPGKESTTSQKGQGVPDDSPGQSSSSNTICTAAQKPPKDKPTIGLKALKSCLDALEKLKGIRRELKGKLQKEGLTCLRHYLLPDCPWRCQKRGFFGIS